MASQTPAQRRAAKQQAENQSHIATLVAAALAGVWALLDLNDVAGTVDAFVEGVNAVVQQYAAISQTTAADFYEEARREAGVTGPYTAHIGDLPPLEQVEASTRWALQDIIEPKPGVSLRDQPVLAAAHVKVEGVVDKMVTDSARDLVTDNVFRDPKANGYARETQPGCCYFCAMLATRGAIYKSRASAELVQSDKKGRKGEPYHNHCHCTADPFWGPAYVPSAQTQQWAALWRDATKGHHNKAAIKAFRTAFDKQQS